MKKYLKFLAWLILIFIIVSCSAEKNTKQGFRDKIETLVNKYIELDMFNGCLLVAKNHEVIYECVHGIANPLTKEQLTPDHRFRLASVTKQFTGVAIMII
jgi:CubicO group peptidase (beta-lactamase class C family)